ncbi:MAG: DUF1190 domain-containing protein [Pseudomonadota bacterium]
MKRSSKLHLALMASLPAALSGCDNPAITGEQNPDWQSAQVAQAAVDCSTAELMQTDACRAQLEQLLATSARYGSQQDCEQANGQCARIEDNGQSAWIGPVTGFVGGYLLAEALDEVGDAFERKRRYGGGYRGGYRSGGTYPSTTGRGSYPATTAPPPPTRAITQSRSGFGSTASARSSFGG